MDFLVSPSAFLPLRLANVIQSLYQMVSRERFGRSSGLMTVHLQRKVVSLKSLLRTLPTIEEVSSGSPQATMQDILRRHDKKTECDRLVTAMDRAAAVDEYAPYATRCP